MFRYRNLFLAIVLMSAYGCVKNETVKPVEFDNSTIYKLPPIAVYMKRPSPELDEDCKEYNKKSIWYECRMNFFDIAKIKTALQYTDMFQQVAWADKRIDYSLSIATAAYQSDDAEDLTSAALAGASLFILPIQTTLDIKSEFVLYWRDFELKRYAYDMKLSLSMSIFDTNSVDKQEVSFADALVSHFLRDSQNDNIFSGEFLASKIQASDYVNDLVVPDRVGDYFHSGTNILPDPLLGAQVRYNHGVVSEYIDIFIFPIRSVEWSGVESILEQEAVIVRKDLELMKIKQTYNDVTFSDNEWLNVESDKGPLKGLHFSATLLDKNDIGYISLTYLFILKDKFIKFRATRQDPSVKFDITPFVKVAVNEIHPPDESVFMATIRQNARKNSISSKAAN